MKNKIYLFFCLFLVFHCSLLAQQATQTEVITTAINTMMYESDLGYYYSTDSVDNIYTINLNGNVVLYEVLFTNGSTVLVSGNKSCEPVLLVISSESEEQTNSLLDNYSDLPDALRNLIDAYVLTIDSCFRRAPSMTFLSEWNVLQQYNPEYRSRSSKVDPLIQTQWGQSYSNDDEPNAYNYYTSPSSYCGGNHCPVGCVATAMGQILRYWEEPEEVPSKCTQYDWNNMPKKLRHDVNSHYTTERNAIARLLKDCADAVGAEFCEGICGAGAPLNNVPYALTHFGYPYAIHLIQEQNQSQWENLIRSNLDDGYPVLYDGGKRTSPTQFERHAYVCDGYRKRAGNNGYKYHMNWGDNGWGNAWCCISDISSYPLIFSYYYAQKAVFNIYPLPCWNDISMECSKEFLNGAVENYMCHYEFENNGHNFFILSGAKVSINANDIYLTNGFYAAEGSEFEARIAPCSISFNYQTEGDEMITLNQGVQDTIPNVKSVQQQVATPSDVSVYPNPVTGSLHIALLNPEETVRQVTVTNLLGNIVLQQDNLPDGTINTTPLANGMYIVGICTTDGKTYHAKFVKK